MQPRSTSRRIRWPSLCPGELDAHHWRCPQSSYGTQEESIGRSCRDRQRDAPAVAHAARSCERASHDNSPARPWGRPSTVPQRWATHTAQINRDQANYDWSDYRLLRTRGRVDHTEVAACARTSPTARYTCNRRLLYPSGTHNG